MRTREVEETPLAPIEQTKLAELERVIERNLKTFYEVGNALLQIRDDRLYRATHGTFEEYCKEKWGLKQTRAYQLMDAAKTIGNLESSTIVEVPKTESQTRPLTSLPQRNSARHGKRLWKLPPMER